MPGAAGSGGQRSGVTVGPARGRCAVAVPCLSHGGRTAVRCAARGRGTERARRAVERGQQAPTPAPHGSPSPGTCPARVPFPLSFLLCPHVMLSFALTAAAGPVRLPSPRRDCREILFHNRALSPPCCSSCCFLSLNPVGCLTDKTNLENSV